MCSCCQPVCLAAALPCTLASTSVAPTVRPGHAVGGFSGTASPATSLLPPAPPDASAAGEAGTGGSGGKSHHRRHRSLTQILTLGLGGHKARRRHSGGSLEEVIGVSWLAGQAGLQGVIEGSCGRAGGQANNQDGGRARQGLECCCAPPLLLCAVTVWCAAKVRQRVQGRMPCSAHALRLLPQKAWDTEPVPLHMTHPRNPTLRLSLLSSPPSRLGRPHSPALAWGPSSPRWATTKVRPMLQLWGLALLLLLLLVTLPLAAPLLVNITAGGAITWGSWPVTARAQRPLWRRAVPYLGPVAAARGVQHRLKHPLAGWSFGGAASQAHPPPPLCVCVPL